MEGGISNKIQIDIRKPYEYNHLSFITNNDNWGIINNYFHNIALSPNLHYSPLVLNGNFDNKCRRWWNTTYTRYLRLGLSFYTYKMD